MSAAAASSPTSPTSRSPNHPDNLRKQALLVVDATSSDFTVKSYIGAADQLLEKAEAADRQGQLEQAFVNYIKAASVAASIPKHADWPKIVRDRHPTYSRYQDLLHRVPRIVQRSKRIEDQLREREERTAQLYREQAAATAQASAAEAAASATSSTKTNGHTASGSSSEGRSTNGAQSATPLTGLEARLAALRTAGVTGALMGSAGATAATPVASAQPESHGGEAEDIDAPTDGAVAEALRQQAGSPTPTSDSAFAMRANGNAHADSQDALRASAMSPQLDDVDGRFPHLPTASEFSSAFPSLDDFEKSAETQFPSAPSHPVGKNAARPLPAPPAPPTDVQIARDVPSSFAEEEETNIEPTAGASAKARRGPRPALPTAPKPVKGPRNASAAAVSAPPIGDVGAPPAALLPGSGVGDVGEKPQPPRSAFVTVEELYKLLHPGFEKTQVMMDGVATTRIARKRGLEVLLLDIRSRAEFQEGRIKAKDCVCIEPITLRKGMTSDDLENKLMLAPSSEQEAFGSRDRFDLVVLYDSSSRPAGAAGQSASSSKSATSASDQRAMEMIDIVRSAIYENEFRKTLRNHAVVLIGGFESWKRKVGKQDVASDRFPNGAPPDVAAPAVAPVTNGTGTATMPRNDGQRFSIDEVKRERRQAQIQPEASGGYDHRASIPVPASLMPAAPSQAYHAASSGPSTSARNPLSAFSPGGSSGFSGPSMPAKAYQGGASSTDAASAYASPSYYSAAPNSVAPLRPKSGAFEYPQLSSSHRSTSRTDEHASQVQPPPIAAAANGVGSRPVASPSPGVGAVVPRSAYTAVDAQRTGSAQYSTYSNKPGRRHGVEEIHIGMTGLKNVGNSCYQNATLQCLSASIPLARFMLDGSYKSAINRVNPLGTQGALAEAFAQLVRVLWSERYTFVSPVTFREAIARFAPAFRGYDQHDSQEFLVFLLDGLHEDLNFVLNKPAAVEMTPARENELETLPQQIASLKEWAIYRQRNDSLIVDWFQGQFRNKMTCLTCGKTSTTYNAFINLSLPIPAGRGISRVTLQQCLDAFVREEIMDKADMWYCPRCKKARKATKRLSISRLPHLLLIHLKRFSFRGPFTDKIETLVDFPKTRLDLTNYMPPPLPPAAMTKGMPTSVTQQPPFLYDLYAVTHHFGSLNTGHYTATIRNDNTWQYCDDSRISKGDERQLGTNSPYVLWYRRSPN